MVLVGFNSIYPINWIKYELGPSEKGPIYLKWLVERPLKIAQTFSWRLFESHSQKNWRKTSLIFRLYLAKFSKLPSFIIELSENRLRVVFVVLKIHNVAHQKITNIRITVNNLYQYVKCKWDYIIIRLAPSLGFTQNDASNKHHLHPSDCCVLLSRKAQHLFTSCICFGFFFKLFFDWLSNYSIWNPFFVYLVNKGQSIFPWVQQIHRNVYTDAGECCFDSGMRHRFVDLNQTLYFE